MTDDKTKPAPLGAWTREENSVLAGHYLDMLAKELAGEKYNKAAHRREGLAMAATYRDDGRQRSAGSWEMKMCNASAVMHAAGLRFIQGYKPLGHGQLKPLAHALSVACRQRSAALGALSTLCQWEAAADALERIANNE